MSLGLGLVDAYNHGVENPDDDYAFVKRLGRNLITTVVCYEFAKAGTKIGMLLFGALGSIIPAAGTSAGIAVGAAGGSIGGAYLGSFVCNAIFDKIGW